MKKPKKRLIETFMDEYTGKNDARRVREAAKSNRPVDTPAGRMPRVKALEQENAALRGQLASERNRERYPMMYVTLAGTATPQPVSDFEKEYNRPDVIEESPKGRKIVLDDTSP